uniref:Coiled-coil-helix-coiled-coil-helix domain containing 2 n=1 Tax=Mandrillus leucophaeus TaxID=9568 RepID=A0A2K5ZE88_MANLE
MPHGSRSRTSHMAPLASQAPQMRAAPRPLPIVAPTSAVGSPAAAGLRAQMATTAADMPVGSAVGHTLGHAITGGFSGGSNAEPPQGTQSAQRPCSDAQNQGDRKLCEGSSEVLKQCRLANRLA